MTMKPAINISYSKYNEIVVMKYYYSNINLNLLINLTRRSLKKYW